jgi:23S rRNA (cytidine1920-2'-O)/16S rRNA (cytidine1409-2'-O)-methyltransferase
MHSKINKLQKERLDVILVNQGLVSSRREAQSLILAGSVKVNQEKKYKAGEKFSIEDNNFKILKSENPYVSYGGLKLEKLVNKYQINFTEKKVLDIGASTGGFTDFALKHGASSVTAIDVGYGQLDWHLRSNPKIKLFEKCNFRYYEPTEKYDIILIDVSFISIKLLLYNIIKCMHNDSLFIPLIKPQFETGKDTVLKKGILKNPEKHLKILFDLIDVLKYNNLYLKSISYTALKKHKGNIEYIALFDRKKDNNDNSAMIDKVVKASFNEVNYK